MNMYNKVAELTRMLEARDSTILELRGQNKRMEDEVLTKTYVMGALQREIQATKEGQHVHDVQDKKIAELAKKLSAALDEKAHLEAENTELQYQVERLNEELMNATETDFQRAEREEREEYARYKAEEAARRAAEEVTKDSAEAKRKSEEAYSSESVTSKAIRAKTFFEFTSLFFEPSHNKKKDFKRLAMLCHPDKGGSTELMQKLNSFKRTVNSL